MGFLEDGRKNIGRTMTGRLRRFLDQAFAAGGLHGGGLSRVVRPMSGRTS